MAVRLPEPHIDVLMSPLFKDRFSRPSRHADPDAAIAQYLEELRQADLAGARPPAEALNGLGDAHLDLDDAGSAVEYYRQAAEVYAEGGHHDRAIACCLKVRRYAPDDPMVGLNLGRYYAAKGLIADAAAEFERVIEEHRAGDNLRVALDAAQSLAKIQPDRAAHHERVADLALADGQRDTAIAALREALARHEAAAEEGSAHRVRRRLQDLRAGAREAPPELSRASSSDIARAAVLRGEAEKRREGENWSEAVEMYRTMAREGLATATDFEAWSECARQSGRAASVLEALAATSRWSLEAGDTVTARKAAEEMLLIDPESAAAAEILDWVGDGDPAD